MHSCHGQDHLPMFYYFIMPNILFPVAVAHYIYNSGFWAILLARRNFAPFPFAPPSLTYLAHLHLTVAEIASSNPVTPKRHPAGLDNGWLDSFF